MPIPALTAEQRQGFLGSGQSLPQNFSGAEQRVFTDDAAQTQQRTDLLALTDQFFSDPQRQAEIDQQTGAFRTAGFANAQNNARLAERDARFSRAAQGNVGGSAEANQIGNIQNMLAGDVINTETGAQQLDNQLKTQNLIEQASQISQAQSGNPLFAQALNNELAGLSNASQALSASFADRDRLTAIHDFANDEFSRVLGGLISNTSTSISSYMTDQERLRQIRKDKE